MSTLGVRRRGFTLIELIVVVAIAGVVVALAAPSFRDYILRQRLKGVHAQLVTDLALARSLAISNNTVGRVAWHNSDAVACYTIYTVRPDATKPAKQVTCDCQKGAGNACTAADAIEARTVELPRSLGVSFWFGTGIGDAQFPGDSNVGFDPVDGRIYYSPTDIAWQQPEQIAIETRLDASRALRTIVGRSGRLTVCAKSDGLGAARCE